MWVLLGFMEISSRHPPQPFFAGLFTDHSVAMETCKRLNMNSGVQYIVKVVEDNKLYDYDWNVNDNECS